MSGHEHARETSHTGQDRYKISEAQKAEDKLTSHSDSGGMLTRKFEPVCFLVAEDNQTMRRVVTNLMGRSGHHCDLVVNGEEAVEAYKKGNESYQCILMDVAMPVMGGIEAMKLIRTFEEENSLKPGRIVAVTAGMGVQGERDRMCKLGFTTVLRKPFQITHLNSLLDELGLLREVCTEFPRG